jgi:hypothetical protein
MFQSRETKENLEQCEKMYIEKFRELVTFDNKIFSKFVNQHAYNLINLFTSKTNSLVKNIVFSYPMIVLGKDNKFYNTNELLKLNQNDIIVYNDKIFHIKSLFNFELFFKESLILNDGFYNFYYPYQPFNNCYITINNVGDIVYSSIELQPYCFIEIEDIFYSLNGIPSKYYNGKYYIRVVLFQDEKFYFENPLYLNNYVNDVNLDNTPVLFVKGTIMSRFD